MQCGAFDIVTFDHLHSTSGAVTVGSLSTNMGKITNPTVVGITYAAAPVTMTGANFVDTYFMVGDLTLAGAPGNMSYVMPTSVEIGVAFTAAGKNLQVGDFFTIDVVRSAYGGDDLTNQLVFSLGAGITFATGVATLSVIHDTITRLRFEVTSITYTLGAVTAAAIRIHPITGI